VPANLLKIEQINYKEFDEPSESYGSFNLPKFGQINHKDFNEQAKVMEVVDCSKLRSEKRRPRDLPKIGEINFFKKKAFLFGGFDFCLYICSIVIDVTGYNL